MVVKSEVMAEMCEPQAGSSFLCCPRSLGSALHLNSPSRASREAQGAASPSFGDFLAEPNIFRRHALAFVFICSDVDSLGFGVVALQVTWAGQ